MYGVQMSKFPNHKVVSTDSLIPYAMNSRTHSEKQISQIAASIKEFGFLNPVIVDGENGIIAGHGRVLAAQKLGLDKVPVIEAKHLTDTQRRAYVIADNKLALNSGWDDETLQLEIESLKGLDFDVDILGWETLPEFYDEPDYGILDDEDVSTQLEEMNEGVKKAIQIEFEKDHYPEAQEVISYWRKNGAYVGKMILDFLLAEKDRNEA